MRKYYRTMKPAGDGLPLCGNRSQMLGVRPGIDLPVDSTDHASPFTGGMSMAPDDPRKLRLHLRPISLGGSCRLPVFVITDTMIDSPLAIRPCNPDHAQMEPDTMMLINTLQTLLCDTRAQWSHHES